MNTQIRSLVIVLTIGIALGVFTSFGQTYIPEPFKQLANSYSIWLLFSFIGGYLITSFKSAVFAGVLIQYIAILFYYVSSSIRFSMDFTLTGLLTLNVLWLIGGTLVGPIAAITGVMVYKKAKYFPSAIAFIAGLFFSESLYQFLSLGYVPEGIVFGIVGLLFLLITYLKNRYPILRVTIATILMTVIMYVGYAYVLGALFS